jgi:hypothetical protein
MDENGTSWKSHIRWIFVQEVESLKDNEWYPCLWRLKIKKSNIVIFFELITKEK